MAIAFGLIAGCNPGLFPAEGDRAINNLNAPNGYIMVLIMNQSTVPMQVTMQWTSRNATSGESTYRVGPLDWFAVPNDCDMVSVEILEFSDGTTVTPANLGVLTVGQQVSCGNVIAITADGTPPTYRVEIY